MRGKTDHRRLCRTSVPPFSKPFQKPRLVSWPPPLSTCVALSKKQNLQQAAAAASRQAAKAVSQQKPPKASDLQVSHPQAGLFVLNAQHTVAAACEREWRQQQAAGKGPHGRSLIRELWLPGLQALVQQARPGIIE